MELPKHYNPMFKKRIILFSFCIILGCTKDAVDKRNGMYIGSVKVISYSLWSGGPTQYFERFIPLDTIYVTNFDDSLSFEDRPSSNYTDFDFHAKPINDTFEIRTNPWLVPDVIINGWFHAGDSLTVIYKNRWGMGAGETRYYYLKKHQ